MGYDYSGKTPILKIENISKTFPGVKALSDVSIEVYPGEVLALLGENGAGKSTLMKTLTGVYTRDAGAGTITYDGSVVDYRNPLQAKNDGIVMIFQELSLVKDLSVAENMFLGSLPRKNGLVIDWKTMRERSREILRSIGCNISPMARTGSLSIAQQQMVEIARALATNARIVVLDEPTSSLTEQDTLALFDVIHRLKKNGVGMIYISHKMDEIFKITDRIAVLRDGKNSGAFITGDTNYREVSECMIGRNVEDYFEQREASQGEVVLKVENLSSGVRFQNVSFELRKGEILGLYGLVGAGRTELVETIFGVRKRTGGSVQFEGRPLQIKHASDAIKQGICLVPENRKEQGLVLGMSCKENISLSKLPWLSTKFGLADKLKMLDLYNEFKEKLSVASPGPEQKVVFLSGGNQQKIVIGKWLSLNPKVLILDEPTRGIDVGSKAEIHMLVNKLSQDGLSVIVISSEMTEIMGLCDRIITISNGRQTADLSSAKGEISEKKLLDAIMSVAP